MKVSLPEKCISCEKDILDQGHIECSGCNKPCDVTILNKEEVDETKEGDMFNMNVKSACCNVDVELVNVRSTCSSVCHEDLINKMEHRMGKFVFEKDLEGNIRQIPTRIIVEKGGLTEEEIMNFPKVEIKGKA